MDQVGQQLEVVGWWGCFVLDGLMFEPGNDRGGVLALGAALVWAGHGCPGVRLLALGYQICGLGCLEEYIQ